MATVSLKSINKWFDTSQVLNDISLDIEDKEFVVFVGPSGCGKTTLLRIVAGLEEATTGEIEIDGIEVSSAHPIERGISMVFQSYALYPHLTVFENIAFPLRVAKMPKTELEEQVMRAAETLQLTDRLQHKPGQLSGGQRQRVAIGRSIVRQPKVFLFDEPLSNLDAALRGEMRVELAKLHKSLDATMIYVTHDQVEAMTLADRIVVISEGRLEQFGTPMELYHRPKTKFVAGFIGNPKMNFLKVPCLSSNSSGVTLKLPDIGEQLLPVEADTVEEGGNLEVGIRPEDFSLSDTDKGMPMKVEVVEHLGGSTMVYGSVADHLNFCALLPGDTEVSDDSVVKLEVNPASMHVFNSNGDAMRRREIPAMHR
ncbi:MAG: Maltose/maltodextrin import ATP-binding protein MalK [Deltaproteobacteria bacterium]|jgi:multiple sugar transport system ATP-binding protein|nr:Maltose/maltodextrin import ATP-binding protein MalK [Deltaproteobacteria bacterium]